MRITWDSSLAAVLSFALVPVVGLFAIFVYLFWPHCDHLEQVLAKDAQGRSIVSKFEACTSLGTSMVDSIELKSEYGRRKTIFKYEPNGGVLGCKGKTFPAVAEPLVDW